MNIQNTSVRLKQIMQERNLRQVDLLEMVKPYCEKYKVKINKSDISQYLSGKVKPGQEKLSMLGMALDINETWLMGYDVPKDKQFNIEKSNISSEEVILLKSFNSLNDIGKKEAIKRVEELTCLSRYVDNNNVVNLPKREKQIWEEPGKEHLMPIASHDKDGEFTEEDYKHDDDIMNDDDLWK